MEKMMNMICGLIEWVINKPTVYGWMSYDEASELYDLKKEENKKVKVELRHRLAYDTYEVFVYPR